MNKISIHLKGLPLTTALRQWDEDFAPLRNGEKDDWHRAINKAFLEAKASSDTERVKLAEAEFEFFLWRWDPYAY
jgi:hypothetical protein